MANILEDVQIYVADKLNSDSELSGLCPFLVENKKEIEYEIKQALGKQGVVGLVMTPKATFAGNFEDKSLAWQIDELEIDVVENVAVNRGKKNAYITGQDAAMRLFDVLCPLSGEHEGQFSPVSYEEGEDNSLLVNKSVLKCLVHVTGNQPPPPTPTHTNTIVKYTEASGLPDWEGDIVGELSGASYRATTQIPNVTSAEEVELGTHITSIGDYAFSGCSGLTSVTIPASVTSIGDYAFEGCSGLTSVTIPNNVTSIGHGAFVNCTSLTSMTIPDSVTSIGRSAFYNCYSLTTLGIGNGVTSIGDYAFCYCSGLTSVTIPNGVTNIGYCCFSGCSGLTSVTIPASVTSIGDYAFEGCSDLTSVAIPNSVTSIGYRAFAGCTNLKNINSNDGVYLPDGIQTIGPDVFNDSGIEKLSFNNLAAMGIDSNAFAGCNQLTDVVVRGVTTHEAMSLENYPWGISNENIIRGDRGI